MDIKQSAIVKEVIDWHHRQEQNVEHKIWGHTFVTHPGVYCPFVAPSGALTLCLSSVLPFQNKRVLDIGCGSGVFACAAALSGAAQVVAIDINPTAVENTRYNARQHGVGSVIDCRVGDVFDPVREGEEFDLIFANLPFTDGKPKNYLERAFYDPHLRALRRYIAELPRWQEWQASRAFLCISNLYDGGLKTFAEGKGRGWSSFIKVDARWIEMEVIELT